MACSHALVAGQQKKKPWGSGTTSNVRRAKRANIQWDYLEEQGADTDTPRGLAKHVAALERAMQKAKAKLNGQEEEQKPLEKGTSSRGRSSTPKAKPLEKGQRASRSSSKKGKGLEKGKGKGKSPGPTRSRSTSAKGKGKEGKGKKGKGKKGKKGKGFGKGQESEEEEFECEEILEEEDVEEPKEEAKEEGDQANNNVGGKDKEEEYSYYTGSETESSTEAPKRKPPVKAPPATPPAEVLEKIPENEVKQNAQQALERKPPVKAPPATPPAQVLEKIPKNEVKQNAQQALEKAREKLKKTYKDAVVQSPKLPAKKACILKPAYELLHHHRQPVGSWKRPRVIVDWHNTLELHDQVPPTHDEALDALLEKADVYLLSFCGKDRQERALRDMHSVRQSHRFAAIQTCSMRSGRDGKSAWGIFWGVEAIFDDNNEVCDDCQFYNITPYAIKTKWEPHHGLSHQGMAFDSFPEAVYAYLEKLKGNSSGSGHQ